jgi:hypothetical protein
MDYFELALLEGSNFVGLLEALQNCVHHRHAKELHNSTECLPLTDYLPFFLITLAG